jgi:hypothetical protein
VLTEAVSGLPPRLPWTLGRSGRGLCHPVFWVRISTRPVEIRLEGERRRRATSLGSGYLSGMARTDRVLRPFWLHQAAEYLVGLVIVVMGLQTLKPGIPVLAGGLVLLNAALVDGPLGAFRLFSRRGHRIADVVVIAVLVLGAVFPGTGIDSTSRALLGVSAFILSVVWWNSAFENRATKKAKAQAAAARAQPGAKVDRSQQIGRGAGRLAGTVAKTIRDRQRSD